MSESEQISMEEFLRLLRQRNSLVPASNLSLQQKIVMDEIAGKNNAIQTYDQTLWKIRSGFLTLFFAAWGALLSMSGLFSSGLQNADLKAIATAMLSVSFGLSVGGFIIDLNYIRRKYRCIYALSHLLTDAFDNIDTPGSYKHKAVWMKISGDDKDIKPNKVNSYKGALVEPLVLYSVPFLSILTGILLAFHLFILDAPQGSFAIH